MDHQCFIAIGAIAALLFLIHTYFKTKRGFWEKHGIPELKVRNYFLRSLKIENVRETYASLYKQIGDTKYGGMYESGDNVIFVKDLDLAKRIYVKDFDHFVNRSFLNLGEYDEMWNHMLANKEDKEWKDLRATMSPAFTSGKLRRMFPILLESGQKMNTYVNNILEENGKLDIQDALGRFCLDTIISLAFGVDSETFKNENSIVANKAKNLVFPFTALAFFKAYLFSLMPTFVRKTFQPPALNPETTAFFSKMIKTTISHREKTGETRNDILQLLLDAKHGQLKNDEDDGELASYEKDAQLKENKSNKDYIMTDDLIAANCMLMIMGGYDTTKTAILFAAYALAVNPDIQEKLRAELQDAKEENGGELSYDIVNTHEYLDKVINEVLRMYPPGIIIERQCNKDYPIPDSKSFIPKGSRVWFPLYEIHYDEKHFTNPSKFDPERFSPEVKATRHSYANMSFGHGPRSCIGFSYITVIANRFGLVMTKAGISSLILNYFVEPTAETNIPLKFKNDINLVPTEPIQLKLTPRN